MINYIFKNKIINKHKNRFLLISTIFILLKTKLLNKINIYIILFFKKAAKGKKIK